MGEPMLHNLKVDADGSTDIYIGPTSPGSGKNWMRPAYPAAREILVDYVL
jgi:hypothetical protein